MPSNPQRSPGALALWAVAAIAAAAGGYLWGYRVLERALARPIDSSQTVEGVFMPSAPGQRPAAPFTLRVPRDVRIAESATVTGTLTTSSSEFARASLDGGGRLTVSPNGEVGPAAPAFDTWTWSVTPTAMGQVFVLAKIRTDRTGSSDTFIAQATVRDEFGYTRTWGQIFRVLSAVLGAAMVLTAKVFS